MNDGGRKIYSRDERSTPQFPEETSRSGRPWEQCVVAAIVWGGAAAITVLAFYGIMIEPWTRP